MDTLSLFTSRLWKKLSREAFQNTKAFYNLLKYDDKRKKTLLFIVGCQRSGTTLMYQIFGRDLNSKVYGEVSKLSSDDLQNKLRLNSFASVEGIIDKDKAPLIIVKPLVETQNTLRLLHYFEGSKALWMYRHYQDVALSNLKKFGIQNGINDLRPIIMNDQQDWRAENVSERVRSIILKHFSEQMNPYDAAALFWFARNSYFFELQLDTNPNVMMCKYEDLVMDPGGVMKRVYKFIQHDFPGDRVIKPVHTGSVGKGQKTALSTEIDRLCQTLLDKLDSAYPMSIRV